MSADEMKAITARVFDAWNQATPEVFDELHSPGYVLHDPMHREPMHGPGGLKAYMAQMRAAFPDLHFTVQEQVAEGDTVVTRWSVSGTQRGALMGIKPSNKYGTTYGITISHFRDGKIVEMHQEWDVFGLLRNIGALPPALAA